MFVNNKPPAKDQVVSMRATAEEQRVIDSLAERLGFKGRSELLRAALDFYVKEDPAARKALAAIVKSAK